MSSTHNDSDDDETVTLAELCEMIDDEKEKEEVVIMGGFDGAGMCTFPKGYMKRQAIYACRSCVDVSHVSAGVCHACAVTCHEGHDLIELYTKRRFRCDCGNAKFKGVKCQLWEEKDDENRENKYNHNFAGTYCVCKRPYPDNENTEEMVQCCICEDWFHLTHLLREGEPHPDASGHEFDELICPACLVQHPCLQPYVGEQMRNQVVDVEGNGEPESKRACSCRLDTLEKDQNAEAGGRAAFLQEGWRAQLCVCPTCKTLYQTSGITFLIDPSDGLSDYVAAGKRKIDERTREVNEAFEELPRPVAVEIAVAYASLKQELSSFLSRSREANHVITAEEVREFFREYQTKRNRNGE